MSTTVVYGACLLVGAAIGWVAATEFYRWRCHQRYMRGLERVAELMKQRAREREQ